MPPKCSATGKRKRRRTGPDPRDNTTDNESDNATPSENLNVNEGTSLLSTNSKAKRLTFQEKYEVGTKTNEEILSEFNL